MQEQLDSLDGGDGGLGDGGGNSSGEEILHESNRIGERHLGFLLLFRTGMVGESLAVRIAHRTASGTCDGAVQWEWVFTKKREGARAPGHVLRSQPFVLRTRIEELRHLQRRDKIAIGRESPSTRVKLTESA